MTQNSPKRYKPSVSKTSRIFELFFVFHSKTICMTDTMEPVIRKKDYTIVLKRSELERLKSYLPFPPKNLSSSKFMKYVDKVKPYSIFHFILRSEY